MITVFLTRTPDQAGPEVHEVPDLLTFLQTEFGTWPDGGRITHVPDGRNVTPSIPADIAKLRDLPGPFSVEVYPRVPGADLALAVFMMIVSAVVSGVLAPKMPSATQRTVRDESPNNGLSERVNRERVNGRIPDIYGSVRSTPDLLSAYKVFENHVEKEIAYMCVGRGAFEIHDVRDDTTPVEEIAGASVAVYGPETSPNSGAPQLLMGNAITAPLMMAKRVNSVNGQVLQPPNYANVVFEPTRFEAPNVIRSMNTDVDYTEHFIAGDVITVSGAAVSKGTYSYQIGEDEALIDGQAGTITFPGNHTANWQAGHALTISNGAVHWEAESSSGDYTAYGNINGAYPITNVALAGGDTRLTLDVSQNSNAWRFPVGGPGGGVATAIGGPKLTRPSDEVLYDLSGTYTINTLTGSTITLSSPSTENPDWDVLAGEPGGTSPTVRATIEAQAERWVGWFTVESVEPVSRVLANIVALNGLFKDSGRRQYRENVEVELQARPVDSQGDPTGPVVSIVRTVEGSSNTRSTRALTIDTDLGSASARWQFRMRRTSDTDTRFEGSVVDEIKWRDLYASSAVTTPHFGNVTTVHSVSYATDGALAIKERKLNLLVTRKLPVRVDGDEFTAELYPTNNVADIICAACLDPKIGNRNLDEIDIDNLYNTADEINDYFGIGVAKFNYTIDSDNLSFEEIYGMMARAVFCEPYRRGSVLRLFFERATDDSAILFNHRNKLPGSETRTTSFGPQESYDGVEYQWVRPSDDSIQTIYLPADRSAINPQRIESVGVRIYEQAMLHAWRAYNKILYQNEASKFDGLPEANLLTRRERILLSDNTRAQPQDGDIISVVGRTVTLSQPIEWDEALEYVIFLQNSDAQVESMPVAPGAGAFQAVLSRDPRTPIVTEGYNATKFIVTEQGDDVRARPFIVQEKGPRDENGAIPLEAINYDARYYANDHDFA